MQKPLLRSSMERSGAISLPRAFPWLIVGMAGAVVSVYGLLANDISTPTVYLVLAAIGMALFRRAAATFFALSYSLNTVVMVCLAVYLINVHGQPFLSGGDEIIFHEASVTLARAWSRGNWAFQATYTGYSGYGFILVGGMLHLLLLPLHSVSPLAIRIVNSFVGASIPVAIYRTGNQLWPGGDRVISARAAMATALFPILVFYSSVGLRDIWIAAACAWCVYSLTRARTLTGWITFGLLGPVALAGITYSFRPDSLAPLLSMYAVFILTLPMSQYGRVAKLVAVLAIGLAVVSAIGNLEGIFAQKRIAYDELALSNAEEGSLGAKLITLPSPASEIARFAYAVFAPIPPLEGFDLDQLIVGFGAAEWYFILPLAVIGALAAARAGPLPRAFAFGTLAYSVVLLFGVAMTSGNSRHKTPLFGLAILLAAFAVTVQGRNSTVRVLATSAWAYSGLAVLYFILKQLA